MKPLKEEEDCYDTSRHHWTAVDYYDKIKSSLGMREPGRNYNI